MYDQHSQSMYSTCLHRNVRVITRGRMTFYGGDVWDDYQDQVLCLDCQSVLPEVEVRQSWAGMGTSIHAASQEG